MRTLARSKAACSIQPTKFRHQFTSWSLPLSWAMRNTGGPDSSGSASVSMDAFTSGTQPFRDRTRVRVRNMDGKPRTYSDTLRTFGGRDGSAAAAAEAGGKVIGTPAAAEAEAGGKVIGTPAAAVRRRIESLFTTLCCVHEGREPALSARAGGEAGGSGSPCVNPAEALRAAVVRFLADMRAAMCTSLVEHFAGWLFFESHRAYSVSRSRRELRA